MNRATLSALTVVLIGCGMASGALRARYTYCQNHDGTVNNGCAPESYSDEWLGKVTPGIWDGWDAETGFDGVESGGALGNAPYVSAEYWVDSVFEHKAVSRRKDAPLVEGWISPSDLVDETYAMGTDAYFVILAGGINIEEPGTYTFSNKSNDGFKLWIDKDGDGEVEITWESPDVVVESKNDSGSVTIASTGYVKCAIWYWEWGEVGHCELSWRTPGDVMKPMPAEAFGRAIGGPPKVHITGIEVGGEQIPQDSWGTINAEECQPVTLSAEAENMNDESPVFIWDLYGNGNVIKETAESSITYAYAYDPAAFVLLPQVKVKRGTTISAAAPETPLIWLSDDETVDACDISPVLSRATNAPVRFSAGHTVVRYDIFGRKIPRDAISARGVRIETDASRTLRRKVLAR
jgi:hypothetical protein